MEIETFMEIETQHWEPLVHSPLVESILYLEAPVSLEWVDKKEPGGPLVDAFSSVGFSFEQDLHPIHRNFPQQLPQRIQGYRFISSDKQKYVQVLRNAIIFSWMKPYSCWTAFRQTALDVWNSIKDLRSDKHIARFGVRAINRIPLLNGFKDLPKLVKGMRSPEDALFTPCGFQKSEMFQHRGGKYYAVLTQKVVPPPKNAKEQASLIYDIDIFGTPNEEWETEKLQTQIDLLHQLRNRLFFSELEKTELEKQIARQES